MRGATSEEWGFSSAWFEVICEGRSAPIFGNEMFAKVEGARSVGDERRTRGPHLTAGLREQIGGAFPSPCG